MPAYLLYGQDTFSSKRKLEEIKKRFANVNKGDINISILEGENISFAKIKQTISLRPFLAPKRLVIIKNFLAKADEELERKVASLLDKIPSFSIVVFYEEGDVKKQSSLFLKLKSSKATQNFSLLSPSSLLKWAKQEVEKRGGKIEHNALSKLIQMTGPDLWRASLEIDKLISYKMGKIIKEEDVELLVKGESHPKIFELIDALGEKKNQKALFLLSELLALGESESYILSMIAYQLRNLLMIKEAEGRKASPNNLGLHPYVFRKLKNQAHNFSQEQLRVAYNKLIETDIQIKSGLLKPDLALDLLITELAS